MVKRPRACPAADKPAIADLASHEEQFRLLVESVKDYAILMIDPKGFVIARNEFLLHYQPLVSVADGRVTGVEAVVRWLRPNKGLTPPDQFIPLAEQTGLIVPLGDWVLKTASAQMQKWITSGTALQTVAVYLSSRQFQ